MSYRLLLVSILSISLSFAEASPPSNEQIVETQIAEYLTHLFQDEKATPSQKDLYKKLKSIDQVGHGYAKAQLSRDLINLQEKEIDEDEPDEVKAYVTEFKTLVVKLKKVLEHEDALDDWEDFYEEIDEVMETYEDEGEDFAEIDTIKDIIDNSDLDTDSPYQMVLNKALELPSDEVHQQLKTENAYVSATKCQACHPAHFEDWSISQHAYSQTSPVYMAMQNAINVLTHGTNGDFCIRCHNQVGMNKKEPTFMKNAHRHPASREGITCIVCHRISPGDDISKEDAINEGSLNYGKVSGRMDLFEGDLNDLVFGPDGGHGSKANDEINSVKQDIHKASGKFDQISTSGFCSTCHDVNLYNGFRLEEAFSEYKSSPAAKKNISCQDCHMGVSQGEVVLGADGKIDRFNNYKHGKVALSSSKDRKMTNHMFSGPDHSVVHPGIFPTSDDLVKMATLEEWLDFEFEAGWGSQRWENQHMKNGEDYLIPPDKDGKPSRWTYRVHREKARQIILQQFHRLANARRGRVGVLKKGFRLVPLENESGLIKVNKASKTDLRFDVAVKNPTDGHNTPTGFIAERLIWVRVEVTKSGEKKPIFLSGDLDPNGDLRDSHSLFIHDAGSRKTIGDGFEAQRLLYKPTKLIPHDTLEKIKFDTQLFSLQSKFITRNIRGGEREQVLAINHSVDTLPFIRPSTSSTVLTGQPGGARIHRLSLPPLSTKKVSYKVDKKKMKGPGTYNINVQLKVGMVPVNLIDAIKGVGFDYDLSTRTIARRIVHGFSMERQQLRGYAIPDEALYQSIISDTKRRGQAKILNPEIQNVLNDDDRTKFIDEMTMKIFAEEVQQKRIDHLIELLSKSSVYKTWNAPGTEYSSTLEWVEGNNIDRLVDLEYFLKREYSKASKEDQTIIMKAMEIAAPPKREQLFKYQHRSDYWKRDSKLKANLSGLTADGLVLEKIAGHEVLQETNIEVVIE